MNIGSVKEIKNNENRVGITPVGAKTLSSSGTASSSSIMPEKRQDILTTITYQQAQKSSGKKTSGRNQTSLSR